MKRLFPVLLGLMAGLLASGAWACEKHLGGHQNSSDTTREAISK